MTIEQAINTLDVRQSNTFSRQEKISWLSQLDALICKEVTGGDFPGYTADTDPQTRLLVPEPWAEIYLHYMQAQMDYTGGEMTRYANAAAMYNAHFTAYKNYYNRTNLPKRGIWRFY